ncbi:hypothetical protein PQR62_22765 [Herbaspirillum lusitanum]|uniref:Uncharacterized protein n=1 Tax=Herbaspirillum lusitanum TaxID=213312 RepID=A0ABW9ADY7_9BURK
MTKRAHAARFFVPVPFDAQAVSGNLRTGKSATRLQIKTFPPIIATELHKSSASIALSASRKRVGLRTSLGRKS